jgi:hypothetical protein
MLPPRRRPPRAQVDLGRLWLAVLRNGSALLLTGLITRVAALIASPTDGSGFGNAVVFVTEPLVWPLRQIPIFRNEIGRGVLVADLLPILVIFGFAILLSGIIIGWERESRLRARDVRTR